MGVGIALDDFGTGYSSLVYLTQLPANVLKIDRGFIVPLLSDKRQQAIVERIISLAKALNYVVVAEGYYAISDKRVKKDFSRVNAAEALLDCALPLARAVLTTVST